MEVKRQKKVETRRVGPEQQLLFRPPKFALPAHLPNVKPTEFSAEGLEVLSEKERSRSTGTADGAQREAVREMLAFVERNRVHLEGVTVKELIHEGRRL